MQQKELVEFIARSLVDKPDEVAVREVEGEQTAVIELSVAKEVTSYSLNILVDILAIK